MKAETLVQQLFDKAKVAWGKEKNVLQARIITLEEKVVSVARRKPVSAPVEPALSLEQKKAYEKRIKELTAELKAAKKDTKKAA